MSYDIRVCCRHCGTHLAEWNPTWNYGPILCVLNIHPTQIKGLTASAYSDRLLAAVAAIDLDPEKYRAMEATNGWGTLDELRRILPNVAADFARGRDVEVEAT